MMIQQVHGEGSISWGEFVLEQLGLRNPGNSVMLERLGLARGSDLNKLDQELRAGILTLEQDWSDALHSKLELLVQLALGGRKMILAVSQLAAWELPQASVALVCRALRQQ